MKTVFKVCYNIRKPKLSHAENNNLYSNFYKGFVHQLEISKKNSLLTFLFKRIYDF